jgi:hypothetical protein
MRRSTSPPEILLGFAAGACATLFVDQPLLWALHELGATEMQGFSWTPTLPLGVPASLSRTFWGGTVGIALAWFGLRYPLGLRWLVLTTLFAAGVRTVADWFVAPMFEGPEWVGLTASGLILLPVVNLGWAAACAVLLAAFTLALGTWGMRRAT